MKVLKKLLATCMVAIMACTFSASFLQTAHAAQYEIVFKGGLHGTVDNQKSVSYRLEANSLFPNEPSVQANDGYVFAGWSKQLPAVGSKVDRKMVFVAKYDVLVNGISYIVRYVDEDNVPVATAKTMMAEEGSTIVERAKIVENYAFVEATQEFVLSENKKEIVFVYRATNQKEQIRYEEEQVNVRGGTQGNQTGGNQGGTPGNTEEVAQPDQPKGGGNGEEVGGKDTPLAQGDASDYLPAMLAGVAGVALLGLIAFIVMKRKKEKESETK